MPRKEKVKPTERPAYINDDGTLDLGRVFKFQPAQTQLLRTFIRDGGASYVQPVATQCLSVGGIRGGKTLGWLMYAVMHYCLAFKQCDVLVLRRTFKELEAGAITDATNGKFIPKEIYEYDKTRHVLTFFNGSRIIFGHCEHNKERDLAQYLGQAYTFIIVDECGQFSPDAWMRLLTRNTVNAGCEPDQFGNLPIPCMVGCTNPIGPFYEYYRTVFVQKEPWNKPEDARQDPVDGRWWVNESGIWRCIYDPEKYAYQRTTVMDNSELLKRDPAILERLNSLPKAKRDKELLGLDGKFEGQYFDCWSEDAHVINLREDPEAIIWQEWQPVWGGQDWGMGHANTIYLFTKALVRYADTEDYRLKTVCFKEIVLTGGKTHKEIAAILATRAKLPNGKPVKIKTIYFSHEKFSKQVSAHTPADEYSKELKALGLPAVQRATQDRIGSASLMYNMLKNGELVVTDDCRDIILAIPSLMRDPDNMDDVLKVDVKGDDCYDGFRYGLYGQLGTRKKPEERTIEEHARTLGPLERHFYLMKINADKASRTEIFRPSEQPVWLSKMKAQTGA